MSKVITFSRTFPAYHPKAGQPTYFVEAILTDLRINYKIGSYFKWLVENNKNISGVFLMKFFDSLVRDIAPFGKAHTIRSHKKPVKKGDFISPKCWAGKPYNKTKEGFWQIKFAPEIEVKKTFDFEVSKHAVIYIDQMPIYEFCGIYNTTINALATNDGLRTQELLDWFNYPKPLIGKIICWNESIEY